MHCKNHFQGYFFLNIWHQSTCFDVKVSTKQDVFFSRCDTNRWNRLLKTRVKEGIYKIDNSHCLSI